MTFSTVNIHVKLTLHGHELEAAVAVPEGVARARELLGVLQNLTDAVVALGEAEAAGEGKRVSCQKGCGACCRQMVPITQTEAYHLAAVVAEMAVEQRRAVEEDLSATKKKRRRRRRRSELVHREG